MVLQPHTKNPSGTAKQHSGPWTCQGQRGRGGEEKEGLLLVLSLALFAFPGTEDRAGREKKPGEAPRETS